MALELNKDFDREIDDLLSAHEQPVEIEDGLMHSQRDTIKRVTFYSLSEYMGDRKDKFGRRKPFKNVVNEYVDSEVAATDPDFKQLQLIAENSKYAHSMLLRRKLLTWAKVTNFSKTINALNETYCRFGGVIAKRSKIDNKLFIDAVPWRNLVVDQIDIDAGAKIEVHYLSPQQLRAKAGAWDNIEEALEFATKDREHGQATTKRIKVLEIEGEFPTYYLEDGNAPDKHQYATLHAFVAVNDKDKVLLYASETNATNYKYAKRKSQLAQGRSLGIGVVEEGFETQITVNEVAIAERNAFLLSSKVFGKTNAENPSAVSFENAESGTIFKLEDNEYLETTVLASAAVPEFQRLTDEWVNRYTKKVGNQDLTDEPKSGTAYSTLALQTKINSGRSDYRREEFSFLIKEIITDWVLPELAKELERDGILAADFSPVELEFIDSAIAAQETNKSSLKRILDAKDIVELGEAVDAVPVAQQAVRSDLKRHGARRTIHIPKGTFKDVLKHITVLFDDELLDRKAQMQVLSEHYRLMPPNDQNRPLVYAQMVELAGAVSPASLKEVAPELPQTQAPEAPTTNTAKQAEITSMLPKAMQ